MPKKVERRTMDNEKPIWKQYKRPPTVEEVPHNYLRWGWWVCASIEHFPKRPPTVDEEPLNGCREQWWRRIPVKYLPKRPPTVEMEPDDLSRCWWWWRSPEGRKPKTVKQWLDLFGVKVSNNKAILYKRVGRDYSTECEIKYVPGTVVETPDWDDNPERECGGGLHVCPAPRYCDQFRSGDNDLYVELEYDLNDPAVVVEDPSYPEKIRVKKVKVLRAWPVKKKQKN